jgi:Type IV pilin-like G and H, putative
MGKLCDRIMRPLRQTKILSGLGLGLVGLTVIACQPNSSVPLAMPSVSPSAVSVVPQSIPDSVPSPSADIQQKLEGEWRDQELMKNQQVPSLWFADNGKAYIISDVDGKRMATETNYRLNTSTQPMQIDIAPGTDASMLGIFEFSADGKLRIDGGEVRPSQFSDRATLHQKVSPQAQLPRNVQVMSQVMSQQSPGPDRLALADTRSHQGKAMLQALNRNQEETYQVHQRFAGTMAELGFGIPVESDHYRYSVISRGDRYVIMSAQAKQSDLKSFTSVLLAHTTRQMAVVICETAQPTAPVIDEAIVAPEKFQCPAGTVAVP